MRWEAGVELGYFSQQISFDPENTVLEELYGNTGWSWGAALSSGQVPLPGKMCLSRPLC